MKCGGGGNPGAFPAGDDLAEDMRCCSQRASNPTSLVGGRRHPDWRLIGPVGNETNVLDYICNMK